MSKRIPDDDDDDDNVEIVVFDARAPAGKPSPFQSVELLSYTPHSIQLKVVGHPIAWERPGYNPRAKCVFDKQKSQKTCLARLTKEAINHCVNITKGVLLPSHGKGIIFENWAICMECSFFFLPQNKKCPSQISSDVSNLVKFIEDSYNKVLYTDDRQIVTSHDGKYFTQHEYEYSIIIIERVQYVGNQIVKFNSNHK